MVLEVAAKLGPRPVVPISETLNGDKLDRSFDGVRIARLCGVDQIVQFNCGNFANVTWWVAGHVGTRVCLALSVITPKITGLPPATLIANSARTATPVHFFVIPRFHYRLVIRIRHIVTTDHMS